MHIFFLESTQCLSITQSRLIQHFICVFTACGTSICLKISHNIASDHSDITVIISSLSSAMAPVVHRRKIRRQQSRRNSLPKSSSWPNPAESVVQSETTAPPSPAASTCSSSRNGHDDGEDSAYIYDYKHRKSPADIVDDEKKSDAESDSESDVDTESSEVNTVESSPLMKVQDANGEINCVQKKSTSQAYMYTHATRSSSSTNSNSTCSTSRSGEGTVRCNNKKMSNESVSKERPNASVKRKKKSTGSTNTDAMAAIIANLQRELEDARSAISRFKSQAAKQDRTIQFLYSCNERMKHFEMDASRHHGRAIRDLSDKNAALADKNRRLELENHQLRECCEIIMKAKGAKEEAASTSKSTSANARPTTNRADSGATRSTAASSTFFHEAQEGGLTPFPVVVPASASNTFNNDDDFHPAAAAAASNIAATTARRRFSLLAAGVRDLPRRMLQAPPPPERSLAERYSIGGADPQHHRMPPVNTKQRRNFTGDDPPRRGHGSDPYYQYADEHLSRRQNPREEYIQHHSRNLHTHHHPPHRHSEPTGPTMRATFPLQGDYLMDEQQIPPYSDDEEEEDDSIVGATLVCKADGGWRSNSFREPERSDSNNSRRPRRRASMY